jgi:hypothetical protein
MLKMIKRKKLLARPLLRRGRAAPFGSIARRIAVAMPER